MNHFLKKIALFPELSLESLNKKDSTVQKSKDQLLSSMSDLFPWVTLSEKEKLQMVEEALKKQGRTNITLDKILPAHKESDINLNKKIPVLTAQYTFQVNSNPKSDMNSKTIFVDSELQRSTRKARLHIAQTSTNSELLDKLALHSRETDIKQALLDNVYTSSESKELVQNSLQKRARRFINA